MKTCSKTSFQTQENFLKSFTNALSGPKFTELSRNGHQSPLGGLPQAQMAQLLTYPPPVPLGFSELNLSAAVVQLMAVQAQVSSVLFSISSFNFYLCFCSKFSKFRTLASSCSIFRLWNFIYFILIGQIFKFNTLAKIKCNFFFVQIQFFIPIQNTYSKTRLVTVHWWENNIVRNISPFFFTGA